MTSSRERASRRIACRNLTYVPMTQAELCAVASPDHRAETSLPRVSCCNTQTQDSFLSNARRRRQPIFSSLHNPSAVTRVSAPDDLGARGRLRRAARLVHVRMVGGQMVQTLLKLGLVETATSVAISSRRSLPPQARAFRPCQMNILRCNFRQEQAWGDEARWPHSSASSADSRTAPSCKISPSRQPHRVSAKSREQPGGIRAAASRRRISMSVSEKRLKADQIDRRRARSRRRDRASNPGTASKSKWE